MLKFYEFICHFIDFIEKELKMYISRFNHKDAKEGEARKGFVARMEEWLSLQLGQNKNPAWH